MPTYRATADLPASASADGCVLRPCHGQLQHHDRGRLPVRLARCRRTVRRADLPGPAHGPNAGGVIVVHNTGIGWSTDLELPPVSPLPACADIVNEIPMGAAPGDSSAALVWKVYAAFPPGSSPRLKACGWGIGFTGVGGGGSSSATTRLRRLRCSSSRAPVGRATTRSSG